jgi:HSP20 family protein
MKMIKYHPARPAFRSIFDDLWSNDFFNGFEQKASYWTPSVNIKENDDNFSLDLMVPGFSKEDFSITVEKDELIVKSESKEENSESTEQYARKEFSIHSFERTFSLPENVDAENIKANYQDGILNIILHKKPETVKKTLQIEVH